MKHRIVLGVLLLALAAGLAWGNEKEQERIAMAWIDAHNSGDVETMAKFRAKHFKRSEVADWRSGFQQTVESLGTLEPYGVMLDDGGLKVGVKSSVDGRLRLAFEFHEDAPDQLKQIGIEHGGDDGPRGGGLPTTDLSGSWDQKKTKLDRYLNRLAQDGLFSGVVLVADKNGVRYEGVAGLASREFNVPNTLATRFDIGSCTKDFTRVAILQLKAAGKLSLDDTVGMHLPDYPNADVRDRVTIQQLLDHRGGLADYFDDDWRKTPMGALRSIDNYIPIWGPKPLEYEPGTKEQYSNFGYTVLGAILEAITGTEYPDYVMDNILRPLGIEDSGFFATDAVVPNVAVGYTRMSMDGRLPEPRKNIYVEPVRGGPWGKTYMTARDLYTFYDSMMDGKLLEGDDAFLAGAWDGAAFALAGGGPGLGAMVFVEDGRMVLAMANMDPPVAERLAMSLWEELGK